MDGRIHGTSFQAMPKNDKNISDLLWEGEMGGAAGPLTDE